ncbi:MAG: hypothetical protein JWP97_161 [Labilithrix sp.]|nr:hypothetical protein [Labilithrix sp.]
MTPVLALAIASSAIAAYTDIRRGEIPNWLTASAFGAGLVASAVISARAGEGARGIVLALLAATCGSLVCAVLPFILWLRGVMGGGDLKLFVALGALCHAGTGLDIELGSFLTGTALVFVQLAYRGTLLAMLKRVAMVAVNLVLPASRRRPLADAELTWFRFAPAILLATLWITWTRVGR